MPSPKPTVFLSYASEDRASIRPLRDALVEAGVDLWYDENELGGGDAWDQKIRRQIRDCDYFMPVISATTERRKEGYFRREWRLAVERSLDMADDVMFLLPICLDDTSELHARVPEKFTTVQWLRLPGGVPTTALHALLRKLAAGDHEMPPVLTKPATAKRLSRETPPALPTGKHANAENHHDGPPPMPAFPHMAEKGGFASGLKFGAEVIWWAISAAWLLIKRAPRWIRVLLSIWFVFFVFSTCSRNSGSNKPAKPAAEKSAASNEEATAKKEAAAKAVRETVERLSKLGQSKTGADAGPPSGIGAMGSELARGIVSGLKGLESYGKQIVVVPFAVGGASAADTQMAGDILAALYGQLAIKRPDETAINSTPLATFDEKSLVALGKQLGADYVLSAQFLQDNGAATLDVRLMKSDDASVAWKATYPLAGKDATDLGNEIATAVLEATPGK